MPVDCSDLDQLAEDAKCWAAKFDQQQLQAAIAYLTCQAANAGGGGGTIGGSTGATDNALLRADGAGGVTLQNSAVIVDDSGNMTGVGSLTCTAFAIDQTTYSGRTLNRMRSDGANESVVLGSTGTGYISIQTPDGTTTGGNQRGNYSVDFQPLRGAASQVTSGELSFASGAYCTTAGQYGWSHGFQCSSSGAYTLSFGSSSTATSDYDLALGFSCAANGYKSMASGGGAKSYLVGQFTRSGAAIAATGDNQFSLVTANAATSNATPTNLLFEFGNRIVVPANSTGVATIRLTARTNTAGAKWATTVRQFSWTKGTTAGSLAISAIDTIGTDRGSNAGAWPAGWALAITADTANGALDLQVTGEAATNIRWSAGIEWQEVTFA